MVFITKLGPQVSLSPVPFFGVNSDADIGLEVSDHWEIFEVIQRSKSSSQVRLW
jgi:hypothetical protein